MPNNTTSSQDQYCLVQLIDKSWGDEVQGKANGMDIENSEVHSLKTFCICQGQLGHEINCGINMPQVQDRSTDLCATTLPWLNDHNKV